MFATEFLIPVIFYTRTPDFVSPPCWNNILFMKNVEKQLNSPLICVFKIQRPFYSHGSKNNLHQPDIAKNLNSSISNRIKVVGHLPQHKSKKHFPMVHKLKLGLYTNNNTFYLCHAHCKPCYFQLCFSAKAIPYFSFSCNT